MALSTTSSPTPLSPLPFPSFPLILNSSLNSFYMHYFSSTHNFIYPILILYLLFSTHPVLTFSPLFFILARLTHNMFLPCPLLLPILLTSSIFAIACVSFAVLPTFSTRSSYLYPLSSTPLIMTYLFLSSLQTLSFSVSDLFRDLWFSSTASQLLPISSSFSAYFFFFTVASPFPSSHTPPISFPLFPSSTLSLFTFPSSIFSSLPCPVQFYLFHYLPETTFIFVATSSQPAPLFTGDLSIFVLFLNAF